MFTHIPSTGSLKNGKQAQSTPSLKLEIVPVLQKLGASRRTNKRLQGH